MLEFAAYATYFGNKNIFGCIYIYIYIFIYLYIFVLLIYASFFNTNVNKYIQKFNFNFMSYSLFDLTCEL